MQLLRGKVVNNDSPTRDGRVQVRIFVLHPEESVKDADLPWAEVMQGIDYIGFHDTSKFDQNEKYDNLEITDDKPRYENADKHSGLGRNIVLEIGTWVFCVLDHDNSNMPIVVGTIAAHKEINSRSNPLNQVKETVSGHLEEWDDNSGNERIRFHHRTGTDMLFKPDGGFNLFTTKDLYFHTLGNRTEQTDLNFAETTKGNKVEIVEGTITEQYKSDHTTITSGNKSELVSGNVVIRGEKIFLN